MRLVLDTTIVVSSFLSPTGAPGRIIELWQDETFEVAASEPILAEYGRVLGYEHIRARHRMSDDEIDQASTQLRQAVILVEPTERIVAIAADPADDMFLECAVAANAEYIISRDPHLLNIGEFRGIQILSPGAFLAVLRAADSG